MKTRRRKRPIRLGDRVSVVPFGSARARERGEVVDILGGMLLVEEHRDAQCACDHDDSDGCTRSWYPLKGARLLSRKRAKKNDLKEAA